MLKQQYLPWENYPKKLNHQQIVKPLTVLADFFSVDWPDGHEEKLEAWRYFVKHDKSYEDSDNGPGSILFIYDLNIKLLEAAYLLCYGVGDKDSNRKSNPYAPIEVEKIVLANLSHKEIVDPYLALQAIFKKTGLYQYREYLHEWLYAALYIKGGADELTRKEIKTVFRRLLKLYAAAWLIYQREVENKSI
ncbi:hypothetical protein [Mucilaginibacter flavus]|uniref:hypothetical protein n=1 Tax=Mucilaginibacter flavus TaxID=931504 RepID=UPI0025B5F7B3|nr:hypothetical protein [Mucilaginibacter flavus]MDN3585004.1 hypothetical protein [Mucilaginibacter flavus]